MDKDVVFVGEEDDVSHFTFVSPTAEKLLLITALVYIWVRHLWAKVMKKWEIWKYSVHGYCGVAAED